MSVSEAGSAEEFYSRCLSHALVLDDAARRYAAEGKVPLALATAWGSDVFTTQAVVWERINVASRAPQRRFFEVAGQLTVGLASIGPLGAGAETAADIIEGARSGLLDACEPSLRKRLVSAWPDVDYLAFLPAPSETEFQEWVLDRLEGLAPQQYIARKRAEAQQAMVEAQARRIRSEITEAVHGAYASDMCALDAYLVESAVAAGDETLITVPVRWELATYAVGQLTGLPEGFSAAVEAIRKAMCDGLGDADGRRLRATLVPV